MSENLAEHLRSNALTDPRFEIFSREERGFLERAFAAYPKLRDGFISYLDMPTDTDELGFKKRSRAINAIHEHEATYWSKVTGMRDPLAVQIPQFTMALLSETPQGIDKQQCIKMLTVRRMAEPLTMGFNANDDFGAEDVSWLKHLAVRAMLHGTPRGETSLKAYDECMKRETPAACWVNDIATLLRVQVPILQAAEQEQATPQEFLDSTFTPKTVAQTRNSLLTDKGHELFEVLFNNRGKLGQIYQKAYQDSKLNSGHTSPGNL